MPSLHNTATPALALFFVLISGSTGQVERELQPITCGQTVTVTVASDNDFFPFMLDLTLAAGNKRLDFHTCSSLVRDPDVRTHRCARSPPRLACVRACSGMHPKSRTPKGWQRTAV